MPQEATAVLRVLVTSALGAFPIEDALVTVSTPLNEQGERTLLYSVRTNNGGMTPALILPTPPLSDSMRPNPDGQPFSLYTVEVMRDGFIPQVALQVAMFAGIPAVLPVPLIPLPENTAIATENMPVTATSQPQALYLPASNPILPNREEG